MKTKADEMYVGGGGGGGGGGGDDVKIKWKGRSVTFMVD